MVNVLLDFIIIRTQYYHPDNYRTTADLLWNLFIKNEFINLKKMYYFRGNRTITIKKDFESIKDIYCEDDYGIMYFDFGEWFKMEVYDENTYGFQEITFIADLDWFNKKINKEKILTLLSDLTKTIEVRDISIDISDKNRRGWGSGYEKRINEVYWGYYIGKQYCENYGGEDKLMNLPAKHVVRFGNGIFYFLSENIKPHETIFYKLRKLLVFIFLLTRKYKNTFINNYVYQPKGKVNFIQGNICEFRLVGYGEKNNLKEFSKITENNNSEKHFINVYVEDIEYRKIKNNNYKVDISGACSWSIYSCMFTGENTYSETNPDNFISLQQISKDYDIEIKAVGIIETGDKEYYHFKNGKLLKSYNESFDLDLMDQMYTEDGKIKLS